MLHLIQVKVLFEAETTKWTTPRSVPGDSIATALYVNVSLGKPRSLLHVSTNVFCAACNVVSFNDRSVSILLQRLFPRSEMSFVHRL